MNSVRKIVIIDDEIDMLENCTRILENMGHKSYTCENSLKAMDLIKEKEPDLILTDLKMPKKNGLEILKEVLDYNKDLPVIMITGYASIESAVDAMKTGAFDYLPKPFSFDQFRLTVERALRQIKLKEENRNLKLQLQEVTELNNILGTSQPMQEVFQTIKKVAKSDANILVLGESGTGKELAARSLHMNSLRAERPFIAVDCVSLPDQLLESELFGYEKGAFSGAYSAKPGLIELAHKGTVFLDEIGDLGKELQAKLLRVLQERQFRRLGGTRLIDVDIRVIAATNRDLSQMIETGEFREDLYYRLNVISIMLPPLRERNGDITLLAHHFCQKFAAAQKKTIELDQRILDALEHYNWPGNVRELKNVLERAVTIADNDQIQLKDLPPQINDFLSSSPSKNLQTLKPKPTLDKETLMPFNDAKSRYIAEFEKEYLKDLLDRFDGNISRAAVAAEIDRRTIHRLLKKHQMN